MYTRRSPRPVLLAAVVGAVVLGPLLVACGEEQSSTTEPASDSQSVDTTATAVPSDSGSAGGDGSTSGGSEPSTTTASSDGPVGQAERAVNDALGAGGWTGSITGVSVSSGEELIISISTDDETLPALEVCEAARGALSDVDGGAGSTVNVWFTPDLTEDGGDERVLASSLGGAECELVRPSE